MNYGNIKDVSVENGNGVRVSFFVSGCRHHCMGCFSQCTWDFEYGKPYTREVQDKIMELLSPSYISGLTVLGGEPLEPENQECVLELVKATKEKFPDKNIWLYTGFSVEDILYDGGERCATETARKILEQVDILVDGRFIEEKKDISLSFRGSENQRIIDVAATMSAYEKGETFPILASEYMEIDETLVEG